MKKFVKSQFIFIFFILAFFMARHPEKILFWEGNVKNVWGNILFAGNVKNLWCYTNICAGYTKT